MKKNYLIFCFILIIGTGCNLFTPHLICEIISPTDGDKIIKGTAVPITVYAEDEGNQIISLLFYIDSNTTDLIIPFGLEDTQNEHSIIWYTDDSLDLGKHIIKVVAKNVDGIKKSDEIEVTIIDLPEVSFGSYTDTRDGHTYRTVQIGSQTWMADNLAFLPAITSPSNSSIHEPYYYVYDYYGEDINKAITTNNYKTYGVLYNWQAAMNACPDGWHLPDSIEWENLSENISFSFGNAFHNAKTLAANSLWEKSNNKGDVGYDLSSNNCSGFSGLPGGYYLKTNYNEGIFQEIEESGFWWSSTTIENSNQPLLFHLSNESSFIFTNWVEKKDKGHSVRCIQNY
jgi:uncharacterized protein (TIGR02145 family)